MRPRECSDDSQQTHTTTTVSPNTRKQELSEAELWTLDDRQREEHFRVGERRRRVEFSRARRTLARVRIINTSLAAGTGRGGKKAGAEGALDDGTVG